MLRLVLDILPSEDVCFSIRVPIQQQRCVFDVLFSDVPSNSKRQSLPTAQCALPHEHARLGQQFRLWEGQGWKPIFLQIPGTWCRVRGVSASHLYALAHMFDVEWLPGHWGTRICWSCKSKGPTVRLSGCTLPARWSKAVRWPDWMRRFGPPGAHRAASPTDGAAPLGRPRPAGDTPFCPEWICAVAEPRRKSF